MKKSGIIMLVFACLFVTTTLVLLVFTSLFSISSMMAIMKKDGTFGDALGGILLYIYDILLAIVTIVSAALILPFDLIMIGKMKINTWYTKTILIFAIAAIVVSLFFIFALPIMTALNPSSSSSSMISSSL